ncbi:hypothetical protein V502_01227 [Pseudogymnoascus sp. VKM F-4520 (FW-2644)]|nr:hypothetical protein V502_01227 [Pseudogymnoascus sp. VKM F-4520 (FW-2644)]
MPVQLKGQLIAHTTPGRSSPVLTYETSWSRVPPGAAATGFPVHSEHVMERLERREVQDLPRDPVDPSARRHYISR